MSSLAVIARATCAAMLTCTVVSPQFTDASQLRRVDQRGVTTGVCPLKHTQAKAAIAGMLARVTITQQFENPYNEPIEAVYTFPLPHNASVDGMSMTIGGRVVRAQIQERETARAGYEAAKNAGQSAGLLAQQRPNVFTQAVANIRSREAVDITITYVHTLTYEGGEYEFALPLVVGPRYVPSSVKDGADISPPIAPEGRPAGHDVSIEVDIDAGMPLGNIESKTHDVDVSRLAPARAQVRLRSESEIPNRDFILRYDTAGKTLRTATLAHRSAKGGYFSIVIEPPERTGGASVTPKELIFVLDTSGSMQGFPIQKAKETMRLALAQLHARDVFNLITFSGDTDVLFPEPVAATPENIQIAQLFLASRQSAGGTEMMAAIRAALEPAAQSGRIHVVCFMTDGYVGNELEILGEVAKHPEARVFAFGIGGSVNRFLLDAMAREGRGDVEYVGLRDDATAACRRFEERVREPLLTGISLDWSGLPVSDALPRRIPDLFSAKPIVLTGRYSKAGQGTVRMRGQSGGREVVYEVPLSLPEEQSQNDVLAAMWARRQVDELMALDYAGLQRGTFAPDVKLRITKLGLDYAIATPFTSFVAVEERPGARGVSPRRVDIPVELPEGVSRGVVAPGPGAGIGSGRGMGLGSVAYQVGGVIGGIIGGRRKMAPPPPPPPSSPAAASVPQAALIISMPEANKLAPGLRELTQSSSTSELIEVQVLLRNASAQTVEQLQKAGLQFAVPIGRSLQVPGRIAVANLIALSKVEAVRFVVERAGREP